MQAQEIEAHLADLGQELQELGVEHPIRILMIGGAFMLTQLHNRPTTQDVDVLIKDVDDPTVSPLYRMFRTAAQAVASRNQLSITWINDVIADFLRNIDWYSARGSFVADIWHARSIYSTKGIYFGP